MNKYIYQFHVTDYEDLKNKGQIVEGYEESKRFVVNILIGHDNENHEIVYEGTAAMRSTGKSLNEAYEKAFKYAFDRLDLKEVYEEIQKDYKDRLSMIGNLDDTSEGVPFVAQ